MRRQADLSLESIPIAISRYGTTGASTRVRIEDWFTHLGLRVERWNYLGASNNHIRTLLPRTAEVAGEEIRLRVSSLGLAGRTVIMSRGASPFSSGGLEESILRRARLSVYDFDDAIYTPSKSFLRRVWSEKKVWQRSVQAADTVIAGSEVLAESADRFSNNVIMIPSCVEPENYLRKQDYSINGSPVAVWIGTPSTEPFLLGIADALLSLHRRIGLRLRVISAGSTSLGPLDSMVDRIPWSINTYPGHLASADLGIMPLPDTSFERGKCAYKLLQYGATGLPMVGSPVGANVQALARMGGISANSSSAVWEESISSIVSASSRERELMGAASRQGVETHYSYHAWADTWLRAMGLASVA
jgi:glycosyltransferase involved in cell wall biosynthesis